MPAELKEPDAVAAEAYKNARADGTDREAAIDLALARLRVLHPGATEVELRSLLAMALAEECAELDR